MIVTWINEKWLDSGYTLKEEPKRFTGGLHMVYERKFLGNSNIFNLSKGKNDDAIY